ncbi:UNVERIFIED_CONTAM: F-box protein PP2-B1 [Sesamum indicum]
MLAARELFIARADTPQKFPEVAELPDVCWFEIRAKIDTNLLSHDTNYALYLVFTRRSRFFRLPARSQVLILGHEAQKRTVCIHPERELTGRRMGLYYHRPPRDDDDEDEYIQIRREDDVYEGPYAEFPGDRKYPKQRDDGLDGSRVGRVHCQERI